MFPFQSIALLVKAASRLMLKKCMGVSYRKLVDV